MINLNRKTIKEIFKDYYEILTTDEITEMFFHEKGQIEKSVKKMSSIFENLIKDSGSKKCEKKLENLGRFHFEQGIPFNSFLYSFDILEKVFKNRGVFSQEIKNLFDRVKNMCAKGYLLSLTEKHINILVSFYLDLKKEKNISYEDPLGVHIFFLLEIATSLKEGNNEIRIIEEESCPFHSWLNTEDAHSLLKTDYSLIKISHSKIHRLVKSLQTGLKEKNYVLATGLYNEILDASLTIITYIRAHRENVILQKKGRLHEIVRKLRKLSEHDMVTGLHNEVRLSKVLNIKRKQKRSFYIAAFDIDDFRYVNQVYGYRIGNLLLKQIAEVIKNFSRDKNVMPFKTGSDTFILLIFEKDVLEIVKKLKKEIENVEIETKIENHYVKFFPKITAAYMEVTDKFNSADEVIEILEIVLHRGKLERRGDITQYNPQLDSKLEVAKLLDKQVFLGLAIKEKKIVPYFQPIFDLQTGEIFGYEVLFRIEKNGETIPAVHYIDAAYKTGLIAEIDRIVLNYIIAHKDKLEGLNLFINTSPNFIKENGFENYIHHLSNTVFEITEQLAIDNIEKLKLFASQKNVKMALDDFGSGYSSIKAVVELTTGKVIKYLKIDGSLIKDMEKSEENFYIVESIVKMAKTLNLKTVAEFIENEKVLETVKSLGIDYAQGFYLGKPKPLSDISLVEHFHNREYFLKQLKKEIARVKRYGRLLTLIKVSVNNGISDEELFSIAVKISKNIRITDLFVKWDKNTLVIAAPETGEDKAEGLKNKIINFFAEKGSGDLVEVEILEVKAEKSKQIEEFINQFLGSDTPFSTAKNQENSF